ncbi:MAG: hypothetical protein GY943_19255 [Chloroflexi bacterium]|nr:hypothetical protein [Chloroflexota bacterium]
MLTFIDVGYVDVYKTTTGIKSKCKRKTAVCQNYSGGMKTAVSVNYLIATYPQSSVKLLHHEQ